MTRPMGLPSAYAWSSKSEHKWTDDRREHKSALTNNTCSDVCININLQNKTFVSTNTAAILCMVRSVPTQIRRIRQFLVLQDPDPDP